MNLPSGSESHDDRLLVSVLYSDILGFSALADIMDPVRFREILPLIWGSLENIVREHGGTINRQLALRIITFASCNSSMDSA